MVIYILEHVSMNCTSRHPTSTTRMIKMNKYFPKDELRVYLLVAALIPTPVHGMSASRCIKCMFVHVIKLTALNIKREAAHKKAEPMIDPGKTQSTPSSLALQPSPVGAGEARRAVSTGIPKFSFIATIFRILQCAEHMSKSLILTAVKGYVNDLIKSAVLESRVPYSAVIKSIKVT